MSVTLNCSSNIHDTFLHVSPTLYIKIFAQMIPLVQFASKANLIFWCVKDTSLSGNFVSLNLNFAEKLGLKSGESYKISVGPFNCVDLTKVVISLPNAKNDWIFLHENYETIQLVILNQIRLIKRREQYPIYTNIRKQPLWIKIEEFGGYQPMHKLGIISEDAELILNDTDSTENENSLNFPILTVVPHTGFDFLCNPCHKLPQVCSFNDHSFKVRQLDTVPHNVILIPDVILNDIFNLKPKTKILLSSVNKSLPDRQNILHYSIDGSTCDFNDSDHLNETIIPTSNGIAVKMSDITSDKIITIKQNVSTIMSEFADFLLNSSYRLILFHDSAGSGKTKLVREAISQLNYSIVFPQKIIYNDLLKSDLHSNADIETFSLFAFDHVDEYLHVDAENQDEKSIRRYVNLCRVITDLLLQKQNRIVLISRSTKLFSQFSKIFTLPFDFIYTFEQSKTWNFSKSSQPLISVHGLNDALTFLERHILNPLQFSNIYHANQMNLYSSVLISGPSGSGKTFLAQKFIEHYKITCIPVRGPEILDKYVGSSERGVRDLFSRARKLKPCVIFFDEIDSLVPKRGSNQSGVTDRIVNQFLTELDGTEDRSGIFIIATTSRPDLIDKAILRPGRIDQRIELSYPTLNEIKQFIIGKRINKKKLKPLLSVLRSRPDINVSWADLVSVDWNDSSNSLPNLIKSLQVPKRSQNTQTYNSITNVQKLTLV